METGVSLKPTKALPPISWPRHLLRTGLMAFGLSTVLGIGLILILGSAAPYGEAILTVSIVCFVCLWFILVLVIRRARSRAFLADDVIGPDASIIG